MTDRPNVLVFMTDDHGRWASGPYGDPVIRTPSMNELARSGATMQRAWTPCPVCSPARASFWTGAIPSRHGVHDYIKENGIGAAHPGIGDQVNLAQRLKKAGYFTGLCGKWHVNHFQRAPRGFDVWFSNAKGTNAKFGTQNFYEADGTLVRHHGHQATFITDRALRFIDQRPEDSPFFLFVGHTNTHTPHTGEPARLVESYRHADFSYLPDETPAACHGQARFPGEAGRKPEALAQYAAAVSMVDEQVGRIMDELDNRGLRENTLIIYCSDHGHMNGHHGLHTKGNATVPQNLIDESIAVPCLLNWPGHVQAGTRPTAMSDHCDLFATILDAAGLDVEAETQDAVSPGRSLLGLLAGKQVDWRDAQCCEYGNARMIRTGQYKLIRRGEGFNGRFPDGFFDLARDPRERCNCIDDPGNATTIADLDGQLQDWFARYEDPARSGMRIMDQPPCNPCQPWSDAQRR